MRTFAVNIHLKFPFAVVGGVLVIPTYEDTGTKEAKEAEKEEVAAERGGETDHELSTTAEAESETTHPEHPQGNRKSTVHLIERAIAHLIRAGGRHSEADARRSSRASPWSCTTRKR